MVKEHPDPLRMPRLLGMGGDVHPLIIPALPNASSSLPNSNGGESMGYVTPLYLHKIY